MSLEVNDDDDDEGTLTDNHSNLPYDQFEQPPGQFLPPSVLLQ